MRGERPGEERHSLYHEDGLTCAFVRMKDVASAEDAIGSLHDKEILLKNRRDTGPIQVAYAKGEAQRLGLDQKREALPNRLEGKEIVRQLKERMILEAPDQQSFKFKENGIPFWFPTEPLIAIVKEGRKRDRMFENCWRHYCSEGWGGTYEIEPERMPHHGLVQFAMMRTVDYGDAEWFLTMVKSTHQKLKSGELQSSQRLPEPPEIPDDTKRQSLGGIAMDDDELDIAASPAQSSRAEDVDEDDI
ncbi:unnamed protein product [Amoebophrya sp. A25]|nr:unnamed protein product [Amoebophrya sp. A25]|eukprot:GSA25T00005868001.1